MVALCSNRFEGFGPQSTIHPLTPTQCFDDVILLPLVTWLSILLTLIVVPVMHRRMRYSRHEPYILLRDFFGYTRSQKWLGGLYLCLLLAILAIMFLEIARLSVARLGIGLLPFNPVGLCLTLLLHVVSMDVKSMERVYTISPFRKRTQWALALRSVAVLYWVMLAIAMIIKGASAKIEENLGYVRTGQQAQYPVDDSWVDNLTMALVALVQAGLEFLTV